MSLSKLLVNQYQKNCEAAYRLLRQNKNLKNSKFERQQVKHRLINEGYTYLNIITNEEGIPSACGTDVDQIILQMAAIIKMPADPPNKKEGGDD